MLPIYTISQAQQHVSNAINIHHNITLVHIFQSQGILCMCYFFQESFKCLYHTHFIIRVFSFTSRVTTRKPGAKEKISWEYTKTRQADQQSNFVNLDNLWHGTKLHHSQRNINGRSAREIHLFLHALRDILLHWNYTVFEKYNISLSKETVHISAVIIDTKTSLLGEHRKSPFCTLFQARGRDLIPQLTPKSTSIRKME